MSEKVTVTVPGVGPQVVDLEVRADESDLDIARRLSWTFPPGTLLGVSGAKWKIEGPGQVVELGAPKPEPVAGGPKPGEVWKPKDPRRKSGFTIKAVTETEVIAEDGRTVSLERLKRYEKIG